MSLFYPCYRFRRIWEIAPEWFTVHQISVVLLDVDNTLTTPRSRMRPGDGSHRCKRRESSC